jgi:hypothetical protein
MSKSDVAATAVVAGRGLTTLNSNGDQYFMDFVEPPPRSLKTYYRIIERPMALKKLQNMVRGITGRAFTGTSEFKSWDDFEATASLLWKNAFQFNEDDSDIFLIAKDLEVGFPLCHPRTHTRGGR